MPLLANKDLILIPGGSTTGDVTISWSYPFEIKLEHRRFKVGSSSPFSPRPIFDFQLSAGSYTQTLAPGEVYEVRSFDRDFYGDHMSDLEKDRWKLDKVLVHALQSMSELVTDLSNEGVGATFYHINVFTGSTPTHAIMEVGKEQPVADPAGFKTMPNPISKLTVKKFVPGAPFHELTTDTAMLDMARESQHEETAKLTEARFALIRVSDSSGNWEQIERPFQTRKRKLTIDFKTIDPQSIGEPASESEGEMRFLLEVWDWNGKDWINIKQFAFENHNVTLTPFAVKDFLPNTVIVVGPRLVGKKRVGLSLLVREFDPSPSEDKVVSSMGPGHFPQEIPGIFGEEAEKKAQAQPQHVVVRAWEPDDPFDPEQNLDVAAHVFVKVEHE